MWRKFTLAAAALAPLALALGCNESVTSVEAPPRAEATKPAAPPAAKDEEKHGHKPGAHGGIIVTVGRESYHAEAVFEKGGTLRLYMLGKDEGRVQEVEAQELKAYARADGGTESLPFVLKPAPQDGDAAGKTSQFVGELPEGLRGKRVEVTVPNVRINGERFRLGFQSAEEGHADAAMPPKVEDDEERDLYLKPGGKYTASDVKANGNQTASTKYADFKSAHDMNPRPDDKICPVTLTKANPQCIWVVDGKTYEFCCPPCIDEFVKLAKDNPQAVREPGSYRKK